MDNVTEGADLATPAGVETPANDAMTEMSGAQYADFLVKKAMGQSKPEKKVETPAATPDEPAEDATAAPESDKEVEATEGTESEQEVPAAETPESEEVLSQSEPITPEKAAKWQANVQKRIDKLTADKKALEAALEQAKLQPKDESPSEPVVVPMGSPDDKTVVARTDADLDKLERDAQAALDFVEDNQLLIQRAAIRDEDEVVIGGQKFAVNYLMDAKREAQRHLTKYIPSRRQFLKASITATTEAQKILPAMFTRGTPEYVEYQAAKRQYPALAALPDAEKLWALSRKGLAALQSEQASADKPKVKPAASTAPKTAGDTGANSAAKPNAARAVSGEKAKIKAELEKATKKFNATRSMSDHSQMLLLQSRLAKL
jgi:hypothetical protein